MTSSSQSKARVSLPAQWRQVSFICFDLGVMNVIGGVGAGQFYSVPLQALGFVPSSLGLGVLFIIIGLTAYRINRLPGIVPVVIIVADILNTVLFLPKFELAGAVVLIKISFLVPVVLVFISMLRVSLKLRKPDEPGHHGAIESGKGVFALLSSMFVSVGAGMAALLLFAHNVMPAITNSTNPLINIFHDLFLVPALLLLFPLGAAAGELVWLHASRLYLSGHELALFIRYLKQLPLLSRLVPALTETSYFDQLSSKRSPGYKPSFLRRRPWRKYALVASVLLISGTASFILVRGFVVPSVSGGAASNEVSTPPAGALVVSQTGQGNYTTIKEAVANASPGATIFVRAGVYYEAVVIDKDITLMGEPVGAPPTIECAQNGCLTITAPKATIKNFAINARVGLLFRLFRFRTRTAAVLITNGRSVMENCDVTSNNGVGIFVSGAVAAPEIRNVRVHDCYQNGMLFTNRSGGLVDSSDTYKTSWAAIRVDNGSSPLIRRSRIHGGRQDGLLLDSGAKATVEECEIFQNNYAGIAVRRGSAVAVRQSKIFRNAQNGVFIHHNSYGEVDACDVYENNDGIKVADESGSRVLNTRLHNQKGTGVVVWKNSTTEIDGATIYENGTGLWVGEGGKPVVRKSVFRSHIYSGIRVRYGGEPVIEQSQIYGGQGTGIYFSDGAKGVINDCAVFGIHGSNIIIASGANPQIRKTRSSEAHYAGVLVMEGGAGSLIECDIFNNYLGVEVKDDSTLTIQDSRIKNNRHQGFVIDGTSESSISGSTLTGNADGAWKIAEGASIKRERNTE